MHDEPVRGQPGEADATSALEMANAALRASEERYRHLVDSLRVGILVSDANRIAQISNPAAQQLLGVAATELIGHAVPGTRHAWLDEDDQVIPVENYPGVRARREGRPVRGTIMGHDDPDTGLRLWFIVDAEPEFDSDGQLERVVTCFTDITAHIAGEHERQALAQTVSEARRLESLRILAAGVAHDFNNYLTGIMANADLALSELPPSSAAQAPLQEVIAAAGQAAALARRMLAYSGRASVATGTVDLNAFVERLVPLVRTSIPTGITVSISADPGNPNVRGDGAQLADLLTNLLTNAADAIGAREGGISVSTGTFAADAAFMAGTYLRPQLPPGDYAYLDVADTGDGIPDTVRSRMFEPFFTTRFAGRGLGLAAAVGLVRSGNGAIHVESEPGRGTTVRVVLPLADEPAAASIPPSAPRSAAGGGVILVVDDEETVLTVAARALERAGYEPLTATNGQDAVEVFSKNRTSVCAVVLDVTMPGMDGREALGLIRLMAPDVPAVLMSGYSVADLGFDEPAINTVFLQKPFVIAELHQAVKSAIEGRRPATG